MDSFEKLVNIFKKFPTVGSRTAGRFVYYLMRLPQERVEEFASAIRELQNKIKLCPLCFNPHEGDSLCQICQSKLRNKNLLCIVEKEADLLSIENTKKFNGVYFILGGTVATMRKEDVEKLRIEGLKKRLLQENFAEIIVALNPTPEGIATSSVVERIIKEVTNSPVPKITHLARGIPVGGELEYADEETLESALEGRK